MKPGFILAVLSLSLSASAGPALAQNDAQLEAVGEKAIDKSTQTEDVSFRDDGYERMTVPVRLSNTGPYRFLVDTGADRTAISRELAGRLKLAPGKRASLHTPAGISNISTATIGSLQLTRDRVKISDAALLDSEDMGADGILGTDSLRSQRIMFDFEAQTMSIVPSAVREVVNERDTIVVTARRRNGRLLITEARANNYPTTIVLDTGAQVTIGNQALRKKLLGKKSVDPARLTELVTVTGERVSGEYINVDRLDIGGVTLRNLAIVFADAQTFRTLDLDRRPAMLLGMNAMRAFKKMSIDFAARKLRIVLPQESALDVRLASAGGNGPS
jgi:predicted aspartyl protease